jgi:predicted PhzF superfamily epimerase YddE/YHI9
MSFQSKYAGNQLAVFLNAEHIPENQMQEIAPKSILRKVLLLLK